MVTNQWSSTALVLVQFEACTNHLAPFFGNLFGKLKVNHIILNMIVDKFILYISFLIMN